MPDPYENAPGRYDDIQKRNLSGRPTLQYDDLNSNAQQAVRPMSTAEQIERTFSYHPPRLDQVPHYEAIRAAAKYFAEIIVKNTPGGADQSAAIRKLRECVMTANAAVALDGMSF